MQLENDYLKIEVNLKGGALASIIDKKTNENLMYTPDERAWKGTDVVIFPFVGAIKNREFTVNGKQYLEKNHGLIRYMEGEGRIEDNKLIVNFKSNDETLKLYPWEFDFDVIYTLNDSTLSVTYKVTNLSDTPLLFNVGGHPALKASGHENGQEFVFEDTYLEFDKEYRTKRITENEDGSLTDKEVDYVLLKHLDIDKDMIRDYKTLIVKIDDVDSVKLHTNNRDYIFDISQSNYLAVWTAPYFGDYICVEPWWGIPDNVNSPMELKNKNLLRELAPNETFMEGYSIKF